MSLFKKISGPSSYPTWPSCKKKSRFNLNYPEPNPTSFEIILSKGFSKSCVLVVRYFGCTNFEGKKVLVFKSPLKEIEDMAKNGLDPHFFEDSSMVARFVPNVEGIDMAYDLAKKLSEK